jgi:hypothetical protein
MKHGSERPDLPQTFDGRAYWCAYCKRWIEVDPIVGGFVFWMEHPDRQHGPK